MLNKLFGFVKGEHKARTEIVAGITTFLTMSYILAVNPAMFSQLDGMPAGAVFTADAMFYLYSSDLYMKLLDEEAKMW